MASVRVLTPQEIRDRAIGAESIGARLPSLDALRGLIIVLMAIDHARAFIAKNHSGEFWGRALPDYGGDTVAFLTRLVTHLCAPGFMFLMGTGMVLFGCAQSVDSVSGCSSLRFGASMLFGLRVSCSAN